MVLLLAKLLIVAGVSKDGIVASGVMSAVDDYITEETRRQHIEEVVREIWDDTMRGTLDALKDYR